MGDDMTRVLRRPVGGWGARTWRREVGAWLAFAFVVVASWAALNLFLECAQLIELATRRW
jgi:hypothetical protein